MGDIGFKITKFVDLNKTFELDITKLATSEADEAFGSPVLAEDVYTFALVTAPAFAYAVSITALEIRKFSFETGDFTNWMTVGSAMVVEEDVFFDIIEPTHGTYFAKLTSFGATASEIETFLEVDPGSIDAITNGTPTDGAAIKLDDILLYGGQTISFDWQFATPEFAFDIYENISFFTNLNGTVTKLAEVDDVSGLGTTGWQTTSITVPTTGTYDFGFGVVNEGDTILDSMLYVDNVMIVSLI